MTKALLSGTLAFCYLGFGGSCNAATIQYQQEVDLTLGFYETEEIRQPVPLEVTGIIPDWVTGSLYRGAAATWDRGNYTAEHWFDGFSRTHRFEIADGEVSYRSRNGSDELADFVEETGRYPGLSFGGDPCKIIFGAFETTFRDGVNPRGGASTDSIGVTYIPNFPGLSENASQHSPWETLVSTTEYMSLQQLNPETLEPIELFSYQATNDELASGGFSAAHAARDPDGSAYNYLLNLETNEYKVFGISPHTGLATILAKITDAPAAYIHSMFTTENYLILVVWQSDFDVEKIQQNFNTADSMKPWNPERKTLFYVVDKRGQGLIDKYEADAFFAFHEINSYEDPGTGEIVIDLPWMANNDFIQAARIRNLRENVGRRNGSATHDLAGSFRRYRLPAPGKIPDSTGFRDALVDFTLDFNDANIELPKINAEYARQPYRYVYGIHVNKRGYFADSLIKIDTYERTTRVWTPDHNSLPSEPIFVAEPDGCEEDEGVLMSVVMDSSRRRSSLVFVDARTMKEIARASMPIVMSYGFHGVWAGENGLNDPDV